MKEDMSQEEIDNLVEFVNYHIGQAQDNLAAGEEHVKKATNATPEQKQTLDELANETRIIRNNLREFKKSFPQNPEVQYIQNAESRMQSLRGKVTVAIKKFGCGDCMADKNELMKIREKIAVQQGATSQVPIPNLPQEEPTRRIEVPNTTAKTGGFLGLPEPPDPLDLKELLPHKLLGNLFGDDD
jgi:hypothetical protein